MTRTPTRRELLAAGAAACGVASLAAETLPMIDTHIHLYDPTRPQGVPWPPKTEPLLYKPMLPSAYAAMVRRFGITGAVVIEASPLLADNQWVLDLARDNPIIAGYVGHLEPGTAEFHANLIRFAKYPLFRGIRLNANAILEGIARPAFVQDIRRLADVGLMLDAIGSATMISALTRLTGAVPHLRIAIDHMPAEPPGWRSVRGMLLALAKNPQVYCKVSGVLKQVDGKVPEDVSVYKSALDELWDAFGADRVMYGSNWPVSELMAPYQTVFQVVRQYVSERPSGDADKFFRLNSKSCYQWRDRG